MTKIILNKSWDHLLGRPMDDSNYWLSKNKIPIGTIEPYENYEIDENGNRKIPINDIVTIDFDPTNTPSTQRNALNILLLAGSGDGKSLIMKQIWYMLHNAGYYCGYIDPKSFDSGRARKGWNSPRKAPYIEPKGIQLQHFVPVWATYAIPHMAHNFRKYAIRLKRINEREMWQGLGMTDIGASHITKIIKYYNNQNEYLSIGHLKNNFNSDVFGNLHEGSSENVYRTLMNLEDFEVISDNYPELNMKLEWDQGNSICISYSGGSKSFMTFDIGQKIKESLEIQYRTNPNKRIPIMWFLDDASYYAKEDKLVKYNFAIKEIMNIGNNTRSLGLYNCMAVQTLGIIDENVAETYRIKLISPLFMNPDSLSKINIPREAIDSIKSGEALKDRKNHLLEWIMINESNEIIPFFPFLPPVNHFQEIYSEKLPDDKKE